jgi:hypothetical protein
MHLLILTQYYGTGFIFLDNILNPEGLFLNFCMFCVLIFLVDLATNYSNEFIQWCIDWEKVVLGLIDTFKHDQGNVATSLDLEQAEYTISNTNNS